MHDPIRPVNLNELLQNQELRARDEIQFTNDNLNTLQREIEDTQKHLNASIAYQAELAEELAKRGLEPLPDRIPRTR